MRTPDKYPKIKHVEVLPGRLLRVDFGKDGVRDIDVLPAGHGRWEALRDPAAFGSVQVSLYDSGLECPALGQAGGNTL